MGSAIVPFHAYLQCRRRNRLEFHQLSRDNFGEDEMIKPLGNRVIIERLDAEARSAGGIIIPDTAKETPQSGKVIAVGPGVRDEDNNTIPLEVKKGDKVLFSKFGGTEVTLDGTDYLIMKEDDVLAILGKK